jgi:hypothetical protein
MPHELGILRIAILAQNTLRIGQIREINYARGGRFCQVLNELSVVSGGWAGRVKGLEVKLLKICKLESRLEAAILGGMVLT